MLSLKVNNLKISFGDKLIITDFNLELHSKTHQWIKGRSGVGKSTLLKSLTGLTEIQKGEIHWGETHFNQLSINQMADFRLKHLAFVHQEIHVINSWTMKQNLNLFSDDQNKINQLCDYFGLKIDDLNKRGHLLSGGERQRLSLIIAFLKNTEVLLLDEPTSHLDNKNVERLLNYIEKNCQEKTVLLVSHDDRMKDYFNNVIEMQ